MPSTEGIWRSPAMAAVLNTVERVAPTQLSILITGESGTGKEVVARALHVRSIQANAPLVVVDCAAIPPTLLESELFGHKKGAFTGAVRDRQGLVTAADGGTFFLDEIGELPSAVQVKLLRLLEDGSFRPVGGTQRKIANLRVIAATNRNIEQSVSTGHFRADLFHRLNGCRIHLQPLRERPADITPLLHHYLTHFAAQQDKVVPSLSEDAAALLATAQWPGNVRELVNCARYIISLAQGPEITPDDLPQALASATPSPPQPLPQTQLAHLPYKEAKRIVLDQFESQYIDALLAHHRGNVSAAARAAGIDRRSIQRMLKRMKQS